MKRARFFYTLRDFPLEYVTIVLELSELYKYLAFFENTIDEQYNNHRKRYETLETLTSILQEVRPNCYLAVSIDIIKETIDVQIELMNLNLKKLYSIDPQQTSELPLEKANTEIEIESTVLSKMNKIIDQAYVGDHTEELETNVVQLNDSNIKSGTVTNEGTIKNEDVDKLNSTKADPIKKENINVAQDDTVKKLENEVVKSEENKS